MGLPLLGQQVALGDLQLFLAGIAGHLDDLHAVQQRPVDGVQRVGRGDEQHVRQVEGHLQVVVPEGVVLGRVQRLQHRGGRVAPHVPGQLVDLVQQEHRVHGLALADGGYDAPRHRAHIGLAVSADLRLVVHAAQGQAGELAVQGPGDGLGDGGLAHAGRADQADDGALQFIGGHGAHRQVFDQAALDLLHAVVIGLEDPAGLLDVDIRGIVDLPGQLQHIFDVVLADAALRGVHGGARQALQLLFHVLPRGGGQL